ncbi:Tex family protein [Arcticibacter eurypsychrophilus]|uniref:Tex family protein n=1 Tax=Arcticibacter eurypsychrophilus TaxID=1434752 RepID=UPI00084E00D5|nr:Tex family protein [Arcticibacter eurypsychrophilus]
MISYIKKIAEELTISQKQVGTTLTLLDEGATVPFIARYRKEMTGSLDEVQVAAIRDRAEQLRELDKRRQAILKSLTELNKLDTALEKRILEARTLVELEDLYLPYRPKRKTRASMAREKGLQPLADWLLEQQNLDVSKEALKFINEEKGVASEIDALAGARDIIAEHINEHADARAQIRRLYLEKGEFISKVIEGKEEAGSKYKDYFDWKETVKAAPSHRILAMRRGEKELFLTLNVLPPEEDAVASLERLFLKNRSTAADQVKLALTDSYKRLLKPSMETEIRLFTKKQADEEAIKVFAENAKQLLLSAPLGQKKILAIDPGFRTGCKVVCLDEQGKLLYNNAIYPHTGANGLIESKKLIVKLIADYAIDTIAIGNGTAGRETEEFIKNLQLPNVSIIMVNESGASIYSASDAAREEFPDKDITVRGAVSIGRRLMDPLAELVKIDPKSIGVGQYQHDVDQSKLQSSLDDTVISCVNAVGVELNTASKQILAYISGLGPQIAKNIVEYRETNGAFKKRSELKKIPRLGEKAYEQAAGFLRIHEAKNPLDSSAIHPERYALVEQMAADLNCTIHDLIKEDKLRQQIRPEKYMNDSIGLPTIQDILEQLAKPGRDPRQQFEAFSFTDGVNNMNDLRVGMVLSGIVTNITSFGAFVDIGVHQDGLVHLSQLSNRFIKDPNEIVKVHQKVQVKVTEVDSARKRIALSMKVEESVMKQEKRIPEAKKQSDKTNDKPQVGFQDQLNALKNRFS